MTPSAIARLGSSSGVAGTAAAVETPTLVLAGGTESDPISRAVETIPATMPVATSRIVPGFGHGWNTEAPDLFNRAVRAWIEDSPLPRGPRRPNLVS